MKNYIQYRLNLTEANLHPDSDPVWKKSYDFNSLYGTENLHDFEKLNETIQKIQNNQTEYEKYAEQFFSQGPDFETYRYDKLAQLTLYCRQSTDTFEDFEKCTKYKSIEKQAIAAYIMDRLTGYWFEKKE
jgi:hypothetical protein